MLTNVPGFSVGHWTDRAAATGCTVILCPPKTRACCEVTVLNDPAYLQRVETQARAYGLLINRPAAEPYVVSGPVRLVDPVATLAPGAGETVP